MTANGLSLVLRSHEGPDARSHEGRAMPAMTPGYSVDHVVPAGRLLTVFSAPDYPQFQPVDDPADRFDNLAAVAVLAGPRWDDPLMMQYEAVLPRPEVIHAPEDDDLWGLSFQPRAISCQTPYFLVFTATPPSPAPDGKEALSSA